jgi:Leucine-rich repeat (LRR) protein
MVKEDIDSRPAQPVAAENLWLSPAEAPNNHIQKQSSPATAADASAEVAAAATSSGKAIVLSNNNSTGSVEPPFSSLADLKREIISSRRHSSSSSPRRGGGGPSGSPMRATRTSSNHPLPAASAEYVLVAQKRAWAQLGNNRRRDDPETSPRRLAQGSSVDDEPPSRKTVPACTKDNLSGSSSLFPVVTREQGRQEDGGIEAFVAETSSRMIPVAYVEATTVITTDEVEAGAAMKRRLTIRAFLLLAGVVLLTIVIVPVAITTNRKTAAIPAPTLVPTSSPTMGPTSHVIPGFANELKDYLLNWDDLRTRGTPQNAAMFWMALEDTYSKREGWDVKSDRYLQRFVLAVIYFALNGDKWKNCGRADPVPMCGPGSRQSWLTDSSECTWNMIACDENNRVIAFTNVEAEGTIAVAPYGFMPPEISHLTALEKVVLKGKEFDKFKVKGPLLAYLAKMTNLRTLNLRDADFTGTIPSDFAATHPKLTVLDLHNNNMSGPIFDLSGLQLLPELDLSANSFVGTIPATIGSMRALTSLDLRMNQLTGEIPATVFTLTDLNFLDVGANMLRGAIASEIGNLANLTVVSLGPSNMTGTLPPALFSLTALSLLRLHDSQFHGPLRNEDFAHIADTISVLRLENNGFSGPIPINAWESVEQLEELYLYGNPKLTGTITQTFCAKRGVESGEIRELQVGCNVLCVIGCCNYEGCPLWPMSRDDLPN